MVIIFLSVVSFIAGYMTGIMYMLNRISKRRESRMSEKPIKNEKRNLQNCFTDNGDSFSDLLCEVEGTDEQVYVENNRKKQNKAYNYIKEKDKSSFS